MPTQMHNILLYHNNSESELELGGIDKIARDLDISPDDLIQKGIHYFLLSELRTLSIEITQIHKKFNVNSFEDLWEKLETGVITESECFEDLSRLEFLELCKDRIHEIIKGE